MRKEEYLSPCLAHLIFVTEIKLLWWLFPSEKELSWHSLDASISSFCPWMPEVDSTIWLGLINTLPVCFQRIKYGLNPDCPHVPYGLSSMYTVL